MIFTAENRSYVPETCPVPFANNKSYMGGMGWIPLAQFEVQWDSYIPRLIGLLLLETLVSARVPKRDIKNN